jgi:hypothetical protein
MSTTGNQCIKNSLFYGTTTGLIAIDSALVLPFRLPTYGTAMPAQANTLSRSVAYYSLAYMIIIIILAFTVFAVFNTFEYVRVVVQYRYPMVTVGTSASL